MASNIIWRYLDIDKFKLLLEQKALYFCSSKNFEDPFEGEFAWGKTGYKKFMETQEKLCKSHGGGMELDMFMAFNLKTLKEIAQKTYVSCWHENEHECEAMWKLYCKNPEKGVLIKSTKKLLESELNQKDLPKLQLKSVRYVPNFWIKQYNPEPDIFYSKRPSFKFESEFRAFFQEDALNMAPVGGKKIPVELSNLIDEIRISPFANSDLKDEIVEISSKFGLDDKVKLSEVELHPILAVDEKVIAKGDNWYQSTIQLVKRNA